MQDIKNAMSILNNMNLYYNFSCANSPLIQNVASFPMKCKSTKLGSVWPIRKVIDKPVLPHFFSYVIISYNLNDSSQADTVTIV